MNTLRMALAATLLLPTIAACKSKDNSALSPLMNAAERHDVERVRHLLAHGANPNERSSDGTTVLRRALYCSGACRDAETVGVLLNAGANPNLKDSLGHNDLEFSLSRIDGGSADSSLLLIKAGAAVDASCQRGALISASIQQDGNLQVLQALFDRGAPIDCRNEGGMTALHWAALNGMVPQIDWLIRHGANVKAINAEGESPRDLATTTNPDPRVQKLFANSRSLLLAAELSTR